MTRCDYEHCPGRRRDAQYALVWHPTYLVVHRRCVRAARQAAKDRKELFAFRFGI